MSRRHYRRVAEILAAQYAETVAGSAERQMVVSIATDLADMFAADNSRFDRRQFYGAVGIDDVWNPA